MKLLKKWEEFAHPHGTDPTLILLKPKENFNDLSKENTIEKIGSLELKGKFLKLKSQNSFEEAYWKTSISHTNGHVLGVALNVKEGVFGVGVDFEKSDREVSQKAFYRFTDEKERNSFPLISSVDFWTIKEASFKSYPQSLETVIPDYFISQQTGKNRFEVFCRKRKDLKILVERVNFESFTVAFAISIH